MSTDSPTAEPIPPLPRRLAWFAPWTWFARWRPWKRWMLFVGVALVGYVLSPVPVYLLMHFVPPSWPISLRLFNIVYAPLGWLCDVYEPLRDFYTWQWGSATHTLNGLGMP
jgi:hypothetical protein